MGYIVYTLDYKVSQILAIDLETQYLRYTIYVNNIYTLQHSNIHIHTVSNAISPMDQVAWRNDKIFTLYCSNLICPDSRRYILRKTFPIGESSLAYRNICTACFKSLYFCVRCFIWKSWESGFAQIISEINKVQKRISKHKNLFINGV